MAKFHKTTAEQLMAASELPTDEACIDAVQSLTEALLDTIRSLQTDTAHGPAITQQGLKQHKLPANMDMSAQLAHSHSSRDSQPLIFSALVSHSLHSAPCVLCVSALWSTSPKRRACSRWSRRWRAAAQQKRFAYRYTTVPTYTA